jgi:hypothetical protein
VRDVALLRTSIEDPVILQLGTAIFFLSALVCLASVDLGHSDSLSAEDCGCGS